ncbi:nucleoside 2-deoxyribosyltransferase [Streptomyces syringium]|uniref:Nucleoside 2-deoxyribosyltransferase n=1 Tax=Streptomyces syringium TaxID=76729 RepID=A0ABS4XW38_9ACTN|nr:nucleoside 2-deoxyribosyltransferase [Streptomyces syringium]MBP2400729.1 nucleoside 2-deoxyribosyltransferase [Streptomyces syringium]
MYYIAHRLFAAHDRALAAQLAQRLAATTGPDTVFLPFCDTDEEDLVADVKGHRLFQLDRDRLHTLHAMIAILHGPSLDDGVCMEIGYAHTLGVPVTVLSTDFQTYSLTDDGPRLEFPDPLVQTMARHTVRTPHLVPAHESYGAPPAGRFAVFHERNRLQTHAALDAVLKALHDAPAPETGRKAHRPPGNRTLFLEPSPYHPFPHTLAEAAQACGYQVHAAERFTATNPSAAAQRDLDNASRASVLLADVSGPETPPGAALLIGAAAARGARVGAYQTHTVFTHADGREPNWRNLMIQYASDARLDSPQTLVSWLRP